MSSSTTLTITSARYYNGKTKMKHVPSCSTVRNQYLHKLGFVNNTTTTVSRKRRPLQQKVSQKVLPENSCLNRRPTYSNTDGICRNPGPLNDESTHTVDTVDEQEEEYDDDELSLSEQQQEQEEHSSAGAPCSPTCVIQYHSSTSTVPRNNMNQNQTEETKEEQIVEESKTSTLQQEEDTATTTTTKTKKRRSVSFHETVTVVTIPSKDSYSDRIRKFLWIEPHEMMQNTARNVIEFKSENWDWRQVADDVEFYICPMTGEKIHPCHNIYSYQESASCYRPMSQHPFFEKSKQAAMEWEYSSGSNSSFGGDSGNRYMYCSQ